MAEGEGKGSDGWRNVFIHLGFQNYMYNGIYVILNQYIINLYIYVIDIYNNIYIYVYIHGSGILKTLTRPVPIAGLHFSNPYQPLFVNRAGITREKWGGAGRAPRVGFVLPYLLRNHSKMIKNTTHLDQDWSTNQSKNIIETKKNNSNTATWTSNTEFNLMQICKELNVYVVLS